MEEEGPFVQPDSLPDVTEPLVLEPTSEDEWSESEDSAIEHEDDVPLEEEEEKDPPLPDPGSIMYNVLRAHGLTVLGASYCPRTHEAVSLLGKERLPFNYIQAGPPDWRRASYEKQLANVLDKPYKYSKQMPAGGFHRTMPAVLLDGVLIGGADEVQLMLSNKALTAQLRARLLAQTTPIFALPPNDSGRPVPSELTDTMVEAIRQNTPSIRYMPVVRVVADSAHPAAM